MDINLDKTPNENLKTLIQLYHTFTVNNFQLFIQVAQ